MAEPHLSVVRRDLRGVAKALRDMRGEVASFPDLVEVVDIIARNLMSCVIELEVLQVEVKDQAELLTDHQLTLERVEKRVSGLETQVGLERAMEES